MWFISVRTSHPSHDVGASSFETAPATLVEVHSLARRYRSSRSSSIALSFRSLPSSYPDRCRCIRSPIRAGRANLKPTPRPRSRRRSGRTSCCPRWRARWRTRTSTPPPSCARPRRAPGIALPPRSSTSPATVVSSPPSVNGRVGRRPDAEVDGTDRRHQRADPRRALVEERVLARGGVTVVEVDRGLERADRQADLGLELRGRLADPGGGEAHPVHLVGRLVDVSGRPRRPARRGRTGRPGPCRCPR